MTDRTHEQARELLEFYLMAKDRDILAKNHVEYPREFVFKHNLQSNFQGHSFDIWTNKEIIEITDYKKHSKTKQKINDGLIVDFVKTYLPKWPFFVIQKEEIVDEKGHLQPTAAEYLKEHLF
jgi:hypothetical protein